MIGVSEKLQHLARTNVIVRSVFMAGGDVEDCVIALAAAMQFLVEQEVKRLQEEPPPKLIVVTEEQYAAIQARKNAADSREAVADG